MPKNRSWSKEQLIVAVKNGRSVRGVLIELGLVPAGGNYEQVKRQISELNLSTAHFTGMGWNVGLTFKPKIEAPLETLLVENSNIQSYKLKARLFKTGIKRPQCELCGWEQRSLDGRIPVELDHINGNRQDNRLENLRILCPNCHSLQPTHRGKNKKAGHARVVEWYTRST